MLLHIDGEVVEIRPSEHFESNTMIESRYLELVNNPVEKKKKKGRPQKKSPEHKPKIEETNGKRSSTESRP